MFSRIDGDNDNPVPQKCYYIAYEKNKLIEIIERTTDYCIMK